MRHVSERPGAEDAARRVRLAEVSLRRPEVETRVFLGIDRIPGASEKRFPSEAEEE
jgi:hypothetical protein